MFSILAQFLLNRSYHVMVDSCRSKVVNIVSGVTRSSQHQKVMGATLQCRPTPRVTATRSCWERCASPHVLLPLEGVGSYPAVPAHTCYSHQKVALPSCRLLFPSQCLCGTIFLTLYSIVWDWRVSRAGPMPLFLA